MARHRRDARLYRRERRAVGGFGHHDTNRVMPPTEIDSMTKRITDIVLAILLFPLASMIVAVAAIAIRLDSPGPALFTQVRVGRGQRPFKLLKLRTMRVGTPTAGSHEVSASQVTRVGGWLRRYKVDELPQIWSVLRGDMS